MEYTAEADMAHASIDHLRPARGRQVAHAIAVGVEIRAALDQFPRHSELGLPAGVAFVGGAAPRITWYATRLFDLRRVMIGIPVDSPVPDVSGHVVEAVRVWWE